MSPLHTIPEQVIGNIPVTEYETSLSGRRLSTHTPVPPIIVRLAH